MTTAAPTTSNAIARGMLAEFEQELATTRRFIERAPGDRLNWQPHEKSMTLGQLIWHLAEVPRGVLQLSLDDQAPVPDFSGGRTSAPTVGDALEELERSAAYVRRTLPTLDDARMQRTFTIVNDGTTVMSIPRAGFLRAILLNHWYHHRGQLGVYLRLLGASVPSSYGPSADEQPTPSASR